MPIYSSLRELLTAIRRGKIFPGAISFTLDNDQVTAETDGGLLLLDLHPDALLRQALDALGLHHEEADVGNRKLPPTQYLVMEVLTARHRLGEQRWPFPSSLAPALRALEEQGLVGWKHDTVPGQCAAWLTEEGKLRWLLPSYRSGVAPESPSVAAAEIFRVVDGLLLSVAGQLERGQITAPEAVALLRSYLITSASLSRLDGSSASAVSLLTGVPVERLAEYGGMPISPSVTTPESPPGDRDHQGPESA